MSETKPTGLVLSGIWTLLSLRAEKENVTNISQNSDDFLHTLPYDSVSSLLDVYQKKKNVNIHLQNNLYANVQDSFIQNI